MTAIIGAEIQLHITYHVIQGLSIFSGSRIADCDLNQVFMQKSYIVSKMLGVSEWNLGLL